MFCLFQTVALVLLNQQLMTVEIFHDVLTIPYLRICCGIEIKSHRLCACGFIRCPDLRFGNVDVQEHLIVQVQRCFGLSD
jgi:hypothetical protein